MVNMSAVWLATGIRGCKYVGLKSFHYKIRK